MAPQTTRLCHSVAGWCPWLQALRRLWSSIFRLWTQDLWTFGRREKGEAWAPLRAALQAGKHPRLQGVRGGRRREGGDTPSRMANGFLVATDMLTTLCVLFALSCRHHGPLHLPPGSWYCTVLPTLFIPLPTLSLSTLIPQVCPPVAAVYTALISSSRSKASRRRLARLPLQDWSGSRTLRPSQMAGD